MPLTGSLLSTGFSGGCQAATQNIASTDVSITEGPGAGNRFFAVHPFNPLLTENVRIHSQAAIMARNNWGTEAHPVPQKAFLSATKGRAGDIVDSPDVAGESHYVGVVPDYLY